MQRALRHCAAVAFGVVKVVLSVTVRDAIVFLAIDYKLVRVPPRFVFAVPAWLLRISGHIRLICSDSTAFDFDFTGFQAVGFGRYRNCSGLASFASHDH